MQRVEKAVQGAEDWNGVLDAVGGLIAWRQMEYEPYRWRGVPALPHSESDRGVLIPLSYPKGNILGVPFHFVGYATVHISADGSVTMLDRIRLDQGDRWQWIEAPNGWVDADPQVVRKAGVSIYWEAWPDQHGTARRSVNFYQDSMEPNVSRFVYVLYGVKTTAHPRLRFESTQGEANDEVHSATIDVLGERRPQLAGAYLLWSQLPWSYRVPEGGPRYVPIVESGFLISVRGEPERSVNVIIEPPQGVKLPDWEAAR